MMYSYFSSVYYIFLLILPPTACFHRVPFYRGAKTNVQRFRGLVQQSRRDPRPNRFKQERLLVNLSQVKHNDTPASSMISRVFDRFLKALWKGLTLPFPSLRHAVLDENDEISSVFRFRESLSALLLYLAVGAACYHYLEPAWTVVDALYFTVTCFTTVGYGDLCPSTIGSKIFTCIFGVSGICFLGAALAAISSKVVEKEVQALEVARKESANRIKSIFKDEDSSQAYERVSTSRFGKYRKILGRILPPLILVLGGGVYIYNLNHPGPDPVCSWVALYYAIVTASTIGFGDISPTTRAARICAIFYIPIAVAAAGELLSSVADRVISKRKELATRQQVRKGLTLDTLLRMDENGDAKVSQSEYVHYMLVDMGLVQKEDIDFLKEQFEKLDLDNSGYLDRNDLRTKVAAKKEAFDSEQPNNHLRLAMMKLTIIASILASAAAFTPAQQNGRTSVATEAFKQELGAQVPLGFFDPLGMVKDGDQETFDRLRYVEIKHGRIAMLAVVGYLTTEAGYRLGGDINYSGLKFADVPGGFGALKSIGDVGITQIIAFIGFLEVAFMKEVPGKSEFVGDFRNGFIDFGWDSFDDATKLKKRAIELNNGRAAQMGILGLMVHEQLGVSILPQV